MELLKDLRRKSLFLFFALLLVPSLAMAEQELSTTTSQEVQSPTQKTVTMDYNTYKTLKQNSNEALSILKASKTTLTEAQNTMVEQEKLLNKLKETNNLQAQELMKAKVNEAIRKLEENRRIFEQVDRKLQEPSTQVQSEETAK